ncbi:unnamed protein product [Ectocarpus sp. CCAP 1310/34]|nr:unnamed protein product [Ectocarpus sp. CCAP 1310/34]
MMSLRGFGEHSCNVGNIFSGLTCGINDQTAPPRAVRKPTGRPADATRKRSWRNSEALATRKRELAPVLRSLRPQQFQPDETGGEAERGGGREGERTRQRDDENVKKEGEDEKKKQEKFGLGVRREVISPSTLLIESSAGATALKQATVTVRNTGSTALFFSWSRVSRGETIVSANGSPGSGGGEGVPGESDAAAAGGVETEQNRGVTSTAIDKAVAVAASRHAALQKPDGRFFCSQTLRLLPMARMS